jgi:hypothetical protein
MLNIGALASGYVSTKLIAVSNTDIRMKLE